MKKNQNPYSNESMPFTFVKVAQLAQIRAYICKSNVNKVVLLQHGGAVLRQLC